jgi:hypothetical protein
MLSLGYGNRYAIQAGDFGSALARHMCRMYPNSIAAVHLNFCPAAPPLLSPPLISWAFKLVPQPVCSLCRAVTPALVSQTLQTIREYPRWRSRIAYTREPTIWTYLGHILLGLPAPLNKQDRARVSKSVAFATSGSAYASFHGTRPSTIGLVLSADPGALLAWIGDKMIEWTDEE